MDDLGNGVALRNGDADGIRIQVAGGVVHTDDEGPVIHVRVQLISAGADLVLGVRHRGEQLEKPFVLDEAGILQLVRDGGDSIIRGHLNGGGDVLLVEGAQIVDEQPAHTRQDGRGDEHEQQIRENIEAALFPLSGTAGGCRLSALAPAHLLRVPAGGISPFVISHMNLQTCLSGRNAGKDLLCF